VLYDYGQGGSWAIVRADSIEQVQRRYPQLQVYEDRPAFASDEMVAALRRDSCFDIEAEPDGWLAEFAK
jgi:hypothetical protein